VKDYFEKHFAFRWLNGELKPIENFDDIDMDTLLEIDEQKNRVIQNVKAFISNKPFLNMLLWGERGCGKSSLIKSVITKFKKQNLKIVELRKENIEKIYTLYEILRKRSEKFLLFFDDISFDYRDSSYRQFKSVLEGGIEKTPSNVMFAATSNKRHLIKDKVLNTDDIYDSDEINEQMSLYGRFGLIIGFYPLNSRQFLNIVSYYLKNYSINYYADWQKDAESYAIARGGKSARIAKQFAIYKTLDTE